METSESIGYGAQWVFCPNFSVWKSWEPLNQSAAALGGPFVPAYRFENHGNLWTNRQRRSAGLLSQLIGLKIMETSESIGCGAQWVFCPSWSVWKSWNKGFLRFPNLNLEQNPSLTTLAIESEVPLKYTKDSCKFQTSTWNKTPTWNKIPHWPLLRFHQRFLNYLSRSNSKRVSHLSAKLSCFVTGKIV